MIPTFGVWLIGMSYHWCTRRQVLVAAGIGGLALNGSGTVAATEDQRNFRAPLAGENEVPPVDTRVRGLSTFQLSRTGDELQYRLIVANIENLTMAHIHLAPEGENGPVVAWLYPDGPPPQLIEGRFDGVLAEGVITATDLVGPLDDAPLSDLVDEIRAKQTYVNVHTVAHPAGEVRGQIR